MKSLDKLGCTLHALSKVSFPGDSEKMDEHKVKTITSIRNYSSRQKDGERHAELVISLIESLSKQEYNQCMLQSQMMCRMLPKIISHYAGFLPGEIGRFKWVVDRKNIVENKYERCFKELYIGLIVIASMRQYSPLLAKRDYSEFNRSFRPDMNIPELVSRIKEDFAVDYSGLEESFTPVIFDKILQNEFSLEDSERSIGIQVSDLLTSSVNRCLKRNYTNNEKMATAVGGLMINAPRIDEQSLMVLGYGSQRPIANAPGKLIKLMDASSKQLYGDIFRRNFHKNFPPR